MIEQLTVKDAPPGIAHYSPAIKVGNTIYFSGQLPINPLTREKCTGDIKMQMREIFKNVEEILKSVGGDRNNIVKTTAFVTDIGLWGEMNDTYAEFFGAHRPARSILEIAKINHGILVEMEVIAVL
jgi:2-iminobutanoate/2-iminopropanoate deaminase